jgi:flavodoxin
MHGSKILIVFYSRSGGTRTLARALADALGCPIEELIDRRQRRGFVGYLRSAFDGFFARTTELAEIQHDPAQYDLVIIGTPIWSRSMSAPIRTYLQQNRGRFRDAAFFLTHGGTGRRRVFDQMAELSLVQPSAVLGITEREMDGAQFLSKARVFADRLRASLRADQAYTSSLFVEPNAL